jgi:hypothetical protein
MAVVLSRRIPFEFEIPGLGFKGENRGNPRQEAESMRLKDARSVIWPRRGTKNDGWSSRRKRDQHQGSFEPTSQFPVDQSIERVLVAEART